MKIVLIGCGKLGTALVNCFLGKNLCLPGELLVVERDTGDIPKLKERYGCAVEATCSPSLAAADVVIFAVRPQDFIEAAHQLRDYLRPEQLVISVITGVSLKSLSHELKEHHQLVRCVPNLPVEIGQAVIPFVEYPETSPVNIRIAEEIFRSAGELLHLSHEEMLDAATSTSASGAGYLYYFAEKMINGGIDLGFTPEESAFLVKHTICGAAALWQKGSFTAEDLKKRVRSKGGTTEAALRTFDESGFGGIVVQGMRSARDRARELGKKH